MDDMIKDLYEFIWPWTIVFCMGVALFTLMARKTVETLWRGARANWTWNELGLFALPLVIGAGVALVATKYPFPKEVAAASTRLIYGTVCGGMSGFVYNRVKTYLKKRSDEAGVKSS